MAARTNDIALVDLAANAEKSGFIKKYLYASKLNIPAGTYKADRICYSVVSGFMFIAYG